MGFLAGCAVFAACRNRCADVYSVSAGIRKLVQSDWTERTSDDIQSYWPLDLFDPPFAPRSGGGLGAYVEYVDDCCSECQLCPGLTFSAENKSLDRMEVLICLRDLDTTIHATHAIIEAFEPPSDAMVLGEVPIWEQHEFTEDRHWAYRWENYDRRVGLLVAIIATEGRWGASVQFGQCPSQLNNGPIRTTNRSSFWISGGMTVMRAIGGW